MWKVTLKKTGGLIPPLVGIRATCSGGVEFVFQVAIGFHMRICMAVMKGSMQNDTAPLATASFLTIGGRTNCDRKNT